MGNVRQYIYILTSMLAVVTLSGCASNPTTGSAALEQQNSQQRLEHQAAAAHERGNSSDALFYYQQILSGSPDNRLALIKSGQIYLNNGLPEQAEKNFEQVLKRDPMDLDALEGAAISQIKMRKFTTAKAHLETVVSIDEKRWNAWNGLGVLADLDHDYSKAVAYYRKGLQLLPDYPPLLNNLAYSHMMGHQYYEAEKLLRRAVSQTPEFDDRMNNNLALALAWQGNYQEALNIISAIYGKAIAYNNIGYIALLKKEYATAIDYFELSMQTSPSYYERAAINLRRSIYLRDTETKAAPAK